MPTPFSSDDLGRVFDARTLTRGRSLLLIGAVEVGLQGDVVTAAVDQAGTRQTATLEPKPSGAHVALNGRCTCQAPACVHVAAAAFAALERFPELRKAAPKGLLDALTGDEAPERRIVMFELAAAPPPDGCTVSTFLVGERTRRITPTTPRQVMADPGSGAPSRALARLLGGGGTTKSTVSREALPEVLRQLVASGQARWAASGKRLQDGETRTFDAHLKPKLPPKSAVLQSNAGPFYVDGGSGAIGRVRLRQPAPAPVRPRRPEPVVIPATASDGAIVETDLTPVIRLRRVSSTDAVGRISLLDALTLDFDYGGVLVAGHDERQFIRVMSPAGPSFVRRDAVREAAAFDTVSADGFTQMRISEAGSSKGRRALVHVGADAAERWHHFIAARIPALQLLGWRNLIDRDFGPRLVEEVGTTDVQVQDAGPGRFSLDFGIEIDGVRLPLLPILTKLIERGGLDAAQIVDGEIITSLDDGRVVKLPAERIRRLLAIMGDLIEGAGRLQDGPLVLPTAEAATVLELEDLVNTRFESAAAIKAYVEQFRDEAEIAPVLLPGDFKGDLRPYQKQGLDWLQHLRGHGLGGLLADDMGLGKTAQTIAHLVFEHAAGRLDRPALIVVPTSLISNWTAELTKFAPHLTTEVLHGLDRHQRRDKLAGVHVVITTYTVLARDIADMKELSWQVVVLDEAQAIKSPAAKATRAVCQLDTQHRVCLSGTPIENNLEELWSQFNFLMPGLLGDRAVFAKRFRTPIEKRGDDQRRLQLVRRIKPFILRRTKSEVATELPPKHTILRRITLAPDQRELYETIRVTLQERVREQVAERSLAGSRIIVLDALLKLRQVCCDPRLVKLPSARTVESSSKLDDLLEMVCEMIPEGRRILLFSQFTSMLDLIKPRLQEAGIPYVELRGDTRDRAEPVRSFQAGEVPLFLISLKAGGRGLNLTAADTVIHYDPWWNPAVENQASDRAHRIGQTKSVFVYKLIGADTVEERILELQQRKAELANLTFTEPGDLAGLEQDDVDFLFGGEVGRKAA
jgi:superfamily II DNA or RNA helicase